LLSPGHKAGSGGISALVESIRNISPHALHFLSTNPASCCFQLQTRAIFTVAPPGYPVNYMANFGARGLLIRVFDLGTRLARMSWWQLITAHIPTLPTLTGPSLNSPTQHTTLLQTHRHNTRPFSNLTDTTHDTAAKLTNTTHDTTHGTSPISPTQHTTLLQSHRHNTRHFSNLTDTTHDTAANLCWKTSG